MGDNPVLNPHYEYKAVRVERSGPICEITLNRPERLNTFNAEMQRDFTALQLQLERGKTYLLRVGSKNRKFKRVTVQ